jgi:hypothetical protein
VVAKERLPGLRIVSTSNLAAEIVEIMTCADDIPGSTVGQPKHVQHLHPEYSPISFHVSAHYDNRLWNIGAFDTVVWEYHTGIGASGVGTGESGNALTLLEECRHIRAMNDRCSWTKQIWLLIPGFGRSRDGLNM